jgi:hypothetical protein
MRRSVMSLVAVAAVFTLLAYAWATRSIAPDSSEIATVLQTGEDTTLLASDAPDLGNHLHAIYAPDTDPAYVAKIEQLIHPGGNRHNFQIHWNVGLTASTTGGTNQGDSLVLTWSIVPDGTLIPGGSQGVGEPACNSNLIAVMNARYGAGNWQAELQEVFDEWADLTGNVYIFEPNDDGAAWPTTRGLLGTRGDIRISGCAIDGNSGTLAYNFFPSGGDMKIDSTDSFYDGAGGTLNTGFHYVIAHEHGHGAGLAHVCPINATKLMEPFINSGFNTLRHDDIRGAQRGYGDDLELPENPNDSAAGATDAGAVNNGQTVTYDPISIDDNGDQDWIQFTVGADRQVDVTVAPIGFTYEDGDQDPNTGNCLPGPSINSLNIHNLDFEIRDSDGVTVLATGSASPAGVNEVLNNIYLGSAGVKYIRVFPSTITNDVQLYNLTFTVEQSPITATPTVTATSVPPTSTPTATEVPPTNTPTVTATIEPGTPTPTATSEATTPTPTATATAEAPLTNLYLPLIQVAE